VVRPNLRRGGERTGKEESLFCLNRWKFSRNWGKSEAKRSKGYKDEREIQQLKLRQRLQETPTWAAKTQEGTRIANLKIRCLLGKEEEGTRVIS